MAKRTTIKQGHEYAVTDRDNRNIAQFPNEGDAYDYARGAPEDIGIDKVSTGWQGVRATEPAHQPYAAGGKRTSVVHPAQFNEGPDPVLKEKSDQMFTQAHSQGYFGALTGRRSYGGDY